MAQNTELHAFTRQSADKKERANGFAAIALDQIDRVSEFGKGLTAYWLSCWRVDCFGNVFVPLQEDIGNTTKAKYRKILQQLGFFMFEIRQFGKQRTLWVRNLCAPKSDSFRYPVAYTSQPKEKSLDSIEQTLETKLPLLETGGQKKVESISVQEFQKPSVFTQDNLNKNTTNKLVVGEKSFQEVVQPTALVDNQEQPSLEEDKNLEIDHYSAAAKGDVGRAKRSRPVIEDDLNEEELEDAKDQAEVEREERATIKSRLKSAGVALNAQVMEAISKLSTKSLDLLLDALLHRIRHGKKLDNVTGYFRSMIDDGWVLKENKILTQRQSFAAWVDKKRSERLVGGSRNNDGVLQVLTYEGDRWINYDDALKEFGD